MIFILLGVACISLGILFYVYLGYPIFILFLSLLLPNKSIRKARITPSVSFIISCYNEEAVIEKKIKNTLSLDYPKDKIEIIVISDGSTDKTDEIVKQYDVQGVKLIRQEGRLGKTMGINLAMKEATGEIVVFSDANAIFHQDAITNLVANFADHRIGYVVGEARYNDITETAASKSESTYWRYEILLKTAESRLHSIVGGDGAIYAIRRVLYKELLPTDINDFVNPLQIIIQGYRGVYEPNAICEEETSGRFDKEIGRKIRIVNRSFSGLMRVKAVMNPLRTGFYSIQIISHKLLRWFAPLFLASFWGASVALSFFTWQSAFLFQAITLVSLIFLACSYIGYIFSGDPRLWPVFAFPYYFIAVNIAAFIGVVRSLKGSIQTTWQPVREADSSPGRSLTLSIVVHVCLILLLILGFSLFEQATDWSLISLYILFFLSLTVPLYVYFGYPLALCLMKSKDTTKKNYSNVLPSITLLICAYNEENVIEEKICNSLELDYPADKFKVILASDGSNDQTVALARLHEDDRLLIIDYPERRGKIGALLATVPLIESEIIVFSDANTMLQPKALQLFAQDFLDAQVGGVSANVVLKNHDTTFGASESQYYAIERWIQLKESQIGSIIGADGGLYAIRRALFVPPSANIILDDFVISMNVAKQGYKFIYDPEIVATEKGSSDHFAEFRRKTRVMAGAFQALSQYEGIPSMGDGTLFFCFVSHKLLRWLVPFFLPFLLVSNALIVIVSPQSFFFMATLCGQTIFYLFALSGFLFKRHIPFRIIAFPFYFCLVNGAILLGFYKGFLGEQSVKWRTERGAKCAE
jgi:cellulose synthase/poly-beta-1,6-N-acetylglucosamine synthase-like glycosyltransferase